MLNVKSILLFIRDNLSNKDRFKVLDQEHILDTNTGVKLHLYDDYFKISRMDQIIATSSDFTKDEHEVLWSIKNLITDPATVEYKTANRVSLVKDRRESFSNLFENPEPIYSTEPEEEEETVVYTG